MVGGDGAEAGEGFWIMGGVEERGGDLILPVLTNDERSFRWRVRGDRELLAVTVREDYVLRRQPRLESGAACAEAAATAFESMNRRSICVVRTIQGKLMILRI